MKGEGLLPIGKSGTDGIEKLSFPIKEEAIQIISQWEQIASTNCTQFHQQLEKTIKSHYPSEIKTVLDEVLATFILFHPEHVELVLSPLTSLIFKNQILYSKRTAPFYSIIQLFSFNSNEQQSHNNTLQNIIHFLGNNNQKAILCLH